MQGFFLGAGASYEMGMPLVVELTEILKRHQTSTALRKMQNLQPHSSSLKWPTETLETLIKLLEDKDLHYEAVIGAIEVESQRSTLNSKHYESVRIHLVDMVSRILVNQHSENLQLTLRGMKHLSKFESYIKNNYPLNIFSLNHDVMIEEICTQLSRPLKAGYFQDTGNYKDPLDNSSLNLKFEILTEEHMKNRRFDFYKPGEQGVNLYKLHGALDTFLYNSRKDFIRFLPKEKASGSHIEMLQKLAAENSRIEQRDKVRTLNIMTLTDSDEAEHFFDRSIITGAFKFQDNNSSSLPLTAVFQQFKSAIYDVSELICIGYSFGDLHVNQVLTKWLCSSKNNHLKIVDPYIANTPSFLLHLKPQIQLIKKTFFDFLTDNTLNTELEQLDLYMHQKLREFKKIRNTKKYD